MPDITHNGKTIKEADIRGCLREITDDGYIFTVYTKDGNEETETFTKAEMTEAEADAKYKALADVVEPLTPIAE